nr:hypothetical protein [uncultured Haemophilus sp.]
MIITYEDNQARQREEDNLPSVQLALNGTPIYLRGLKATVKVSREEKDTSGQNSSTASSDKGVKAKELSITGQVPFRNAEWLKTLFQLAEASDSKGEQVKYRISNMTAEAVNMRMGVFSGDVQATQDSGQSWSVSFTLKEKDSVAEKTAKRKAAPTKKTKTDKKGKVASGAGGSGGNNSGNGNGGKDSAYSSTLSDLFGG